MSEPSRWVFYAGQLYGEYLRGECPSHTLPDGTYIFAKGSVARDSYWYWVRTGAMISLNRCDVPPELKALCLLMGLQEAL